MARRRGLGATLGLALTVARETLGRRRLSSVLAWAIRGEQVEASGLEAIPPDGAFVLAVNHLRAGSTLAVLAASLGAATRARPGLDDACTLVVGHREAAHAPTLLSHAARAIGRALFARWARSVLRVVTGNSTPRVTALRELRARAARGPVLLFPEGAASPVLGPMRRGAGRFLAALSAPTLPVAVVPTEDGFHVTFGPPIAWARRRDLHDLQLGLALAAMLPPALAPAWQASLAAWRAAHAPVAPTQHARGVGQGAPSYCKITRPCPPRPHSS